MNTATPASPGTATHSGPPAPLSGHDTIEGLLKESRRQGVPIRKTFVQIGKGKSTTAGPLAGFLTRRDGRGLDAYLLLHALASADPWDCTLPSGFWVRALNLMSSAGDLDAARGTISKIMKRLEEQGLVRRGRVKRMAAITLLKEDGSGDDYQHPFDTGEQWLHLPHNYWYDRHYLSLSLRAKVMLLIALERPDGFYLPHEKAPLWYGVSADSAGSGLRELRKVGLLEEDREWVRTERSDTGWTERLTYTLTGPFSNAARQKAKADEKKQATTASALESA